MSRQPEAVVPGAPFLVFTSGKGGVGKSQIVANLGVALAKLRQGVTLIDFDLGLSSLDLLLGLEPRYTALDVIASRRSLEDCLVNGPFGVRLLPAPPCTEGARGQALEPSRLLAGIGELRREGEIVLADAPAAISRSAIELVRAARPLILITTPEPTAMAGAYAAIKALRRLRGRRGVSLIVNRVRGVAEARSIQERLETTARRFLGVGISALGHVPEDPFVQEASRLRRAVSEAFPGSEASRALVAIARAIVRRTQLPRTRVGERAEPRHQLVLQEAP
jgi:flagellar biosynthesis protein FlhG